MTFHVARRVHILSDDHVSRIWAPTQAAPQHQPQAARIEITLETGGDGLLW